MCNVYINFCDIGKFNFVSFLFSCMRKMFPSSSASSALRYERIAMNNKLKMSTQTKDNASAYMYMHVVDRPFIILGCASLAKSLPNLMMMYVRWYEAFALHTKCDLHKRKRFFRQYYYSHHFLFLLLFSLLVWSLSASRRSILIERCMFVRVGCVYV